jgi:hypothetical protein
MPDALPKRVLARFLAASRRPIPVDDVTFEPGSGHQWPSNDVYEYHEEWIIDFGGISDAKGRAVGCQIGIRSPSRTPRDEPKKNGKWQCMTSHTRNGEMFSGAHGSVFLNDRAACVVAAKKALAKAHQAALTKFGPPKP